MDNRVDAAYRELKQAIIAEFYTEAYHHIQKLGKGGLHSENNINRAEALQALQNAMLQVLDK